MNGIIEKARSCDLGSKAIVDLSHHMPYESPAERVKQAQLAFAEHVKNCFNGDYDEFRRQATKYDYTLTIIQEQHRGFLGF